MAQDGPRPEETQPCSQAAETSPAHSMGDSEYALQLTKADLDDSLTRTYDNLAQNFQSELHKSTTLSNTLCP